MRVDQYGQQTKRQIIGPVIITQKCQKPYTAYGARMGLVGL